MNEYDYEPVPGLPARLPEGETILWQGAPRWDTFARRAMRVRLVIGYFALLLVWGISGQVTSGTPVSQVGRSMLCLSALGAVAVALLVLFAWLVARTTLYTITTRRVVMRFGIALPITIQVAFRMIDSAEAHIWPDGSGDIALTLPADQRIAYLMLWPHARPWKLVKAQPVLRGIPGAAEVAQLLGRALASSASQPAKTVSIPVGVVDSTGAHVPAAA